MFKRIGWIVVEVSPAGKGEKWAAVAPIFKTRAEARRWVEEILDFAPTDTRFQVLQVVDYEH